jgi:ketosteroid isomerase-like protein
MSADANVEVVSRFTKALARGDYDEAAAMLTPDFTVEDTDIPESTGADSFYEWMGRWDAAFESWRIEDVEVRAIDESRTLSMFRIYVKGRGSGVELVRDDGVIAELRDAKIVRIAYYNDQSQALDAAGLSAPD